MQFKNFGLISDEEVIKTEESYRNFLKGKDLIENNISLGSFSLNDMSMDGKLILKSEVNQNSYGKNFKTSLGFELRDFLLENYKGFIGGDLISFRRKFQDECFGRSDHEKKQIGLEYFNKYYKTWCDIPILNNSLNVDGNSVDTPRMNSLYAERNYLGEQFRYEFDMIFKYLVGDRGYFNRDLYESSLKLQEMISFENEYSILQYLNDLFGFESNSTEDFSQITEVESRNARIDMIYNANKSVMNNRKFVEFVDFIFSNPFYKSRKYGLAFFTAFKINKPLLKMTAREFKDLCNTYYGCNYKNLQLGYRTKNFDRYVETFLEEWNSFSSS